MPVNKKSNNLLDSSDDERDVKLTVNKEFAQKYEAKKKHEELSNLKDKFGNQIPEDESSSESEDEDGELLTNEIEDEFFRLIPLIQKKDPSLYDPKTKFFVEEPADATDKKPKKSKTKPLSVTEYLTQRMLTKGPEKAAESDDESDDDRRKKRELPQFGKSLEQEQDELKRAFWESVNDMENSDEEEGFLTKREISEEEKQRREADFLKWKEANDKKPKKRVDEMETLQKFWSITPDLDENERFLKDYILNQKWLDKDSDRMPSYKEVVGDDDDDDVDEDGKPRRLVQDDGEDIDRAENFEAEFNFRHQEPGAFDILNYPRTLGDSVRKAQSKTDARKRQRENKKARKAEEKLQKEEELKRLKALKREELQKKLQMIEDNAGTALKLTEQDLEEDFDPSKFDSKMAQMFNDDYYNQDGDDDEKPVFDSDDEDMRINEMLLQEEEEEKSSKKKNKKEDKVKVDPAQTEIAKKEVKKLMDDYYKLDYEDAMGETKFRFNYVKVKPRTYGLQVDQILNMTDKELNQVVGLKKIAPYREPLVEEDYENDEKKKRKHKHKHHNRSEKRHKNHGENA